METEQRLKDSHTQRVIHSWVLDAHRFEWEHGDEYVYVYDLHDGFDDSIIELDFDETLKQIEQGTAKEHIEAVIIGWGWLEE